MAARMIWRMIRRMVVRIVVRILVREAGSLIRQLAKYDSNQYRKGGGFGVMRRTPE